MPPYYFVVYRDKVSDWRWYLWSHENHRKLADGSQGFASQDSCERNIGLVKRVVPTAPIRYAKQ